MPHSASSCEPHGVRPRLGAKQAVAEAHAPRIESLLSHRLTDVQGKGRSAGQALGPKILEEQDLPQGVPRRHGHHGQPHVLGTVVKAQPSREETVAVGNLYQLAGLGAPRGEGPRHHLPPDLEIAPRVADHGGLALGAGGGVDARQLGLRHREEAPRVLIAQIGLDGEGQPLQVVDALDRPQVDATGREGVSIERNSLHRPRAGAPQTLPLESAHGGTRRRLHLAIPDHRTLIPRSLRSRARTAGPRSA